MTVDKSGARVQEMFGQIAPRYDRMNHLLSLNMDRYWRWKTVRRVRPVNGQPILDVCTGTGDLAFAYAKRTDDSTRIVATDFCPEMLDIGRTKKQQGKAGERVEFIEADAQALPFDDNQFQIVTVAFGLRNVADTDQGLREMRRVCKPGGRVAVLEFSMPRWQPFKAVYGWYFRRILPRVGQWFARNDQNAYDYLPESVGEFPHGRALADRLSAAGLGQVKFYPLTLGVATLYVGVK